eukprot:COSAG06_NODE_2509_length_6742_cov_3.061418_8_plen_53_part_00
MATLIRYTVAESCEGLLRLRLPLSVALTGGIRPYAPRHKQYDTWYEGIPGGK